MDEYKAQVFRNQFNSDSAQYLHQPISVTILVYVIFIVVTYYSPYLLCVQYFGAAVF